jgi:short-subunit dehydrogenase
LKEILITGCSSGIGLHCAIFLKEHNFRVFATARKEADVQMLKDKGLEAFKLDLQDTNSIHNAFNEILKLTEGKLYALFNNGAYGQVGALEDISTKDLRKEFETNVFGWHELQNLVLPIMRKQGYGKIIQNSSVLGFVSLKYRGAYNASKYAIEGLSDTLRLELMGSNIFISLIEPGPIRSKFRENAYKNFIDNVDYKNSFHSEKYKKVIERFKSKNTDFFELKEISVSKKVLNILNSKKPKARYYVTFPTYLFGFLKRIFSSFLMDKILIHF